MAPAIATLSCMMCRSAGAPTSCCHQPALPCAAAGLSQAPGLGAAARTRFVLPLKQEYHSAQASKRLLQRFGELRPTMMLFLQQLSCLVMTKVQGQGSEAVPERMALWRRVKVAGSPLVELWHGPDGSQLSRYLMVADTFAPKYLRWGPHTSRHLEGRP